MMFFKGGVLASIYPFSAALILAGFDMSGYAGTTTPPNPLLAAGIFFMVLWTAVLLMMSGRKKEMKPGKRKNGRKRAGSRRKS